MRKVLLILITFISIIALIIQYGTKPLFKYLGIQPKAGLRIESSQKAKVSINNKDVANTPFQNEEFTEGEYLVSLKAEKTASTAGELTWEGYVNLNPGTLTVINRDLTDKKTTSSGEIISLEQGQGVTIISTPPQAEVNVDGVVMGRTPLTLPDLPSGEHQFIVSKENHLKRSIRATLVDNFNLMLTVDLAIAEADLTKLPVVPISSSPEVTVKSTPTGFLRVRKEPSANAAEVGRVSPGDVLILLEELPNWQRVRLSDGKEGYVSTSYTEKKTQ